MALRNVGAAQIKGQDKIRESSDTPLLDVQILLAEVMGKNRTWVASHPEETISQVQSKKFDELIRRRASGEPLPYLLGWWEFYGRRFKITPSVLIPRPETEHLIELAVQHLSICSRPQRVLDVGTGSGVIAITLALESPEHRFIAGDVSYPALQLARRNAEQHGVIQNIAFIQMDLSTAICERVNLVCANLPYIESSKMDDLDVARWEPSIALDGGKGGLETIVGLLRDLPRILTRGGKVILEIDETQTGPLHEINGTLSRDYSLTIEKDLAGKDRIAILTFKP